MADLGFRDVAEMLRSAIESGKFQPGDLMPSEVALSAEHRVSRTTVRRALGVLEEQKLLTVVPGKGRMVRSSGESIARPGESRADFVARILREEYEKGRRADREVRTSAIVAERFGVSEATARQALKILVQEGLVSIVPSQGWSWRTDSSSKSMSKTDEVATKLRQKIASGEWQEGARLPGELTLTETYGVSRVTVRRAISQLVAEGLLETKAGIGTVVLRKP